MRRMFIVASLLTVICAAIQAAPFTMAPFAPNVVRFQNTLYVPARPLAEIVGANIREDSATGATTLTLGANTITFTPDSKTAAANGRQLILVEAPFSLFHGGLAVPMKPLADTLGLTCAKKNDQLLVTLPDARTLALTVEDGNGEAGLCYDHSWTLYQINVDGTGLRRLSYESNSGMGVGMVSIAPDGTFLLTYNQDAEVIQRPVDSSQERIVSKLAGAGLGMTLPISADGKYYYLCEQDQIIRVSLADGAKTAICPGTSVTVSPNGKSLAVEEQQGALSLVSPANNSRQPLSPGSSPVFSPDSRLLIYRTAGSDGLSLTGITGPDAGKARTYQLSSERNYPQACSADGRQLLYVSYGESTLGVLNLITGQARTLLPWQNDQPFLHARFIANDTAVIMLQADGDLYRVKADGTGLTRLTKGFRIETYTQSPDGQSLIFLAVNSE